MEINAYLAAGFSLALLNIGFSGAMFMVSLDANSKPTMDRLSATAMKGVFSVMGISLVLMVAGFSQS